MLVGGTPPTSCGCAPFVLKLFIPHLTTAASGHMKLLLPQ